MTPDDPRLTAGALNALAPDERHGVEAELWSDPELRRELEETAAFAEKLKRAFSLELNACLTDNHWREIKAEAANVGLSSAGVISMPIARRIPAWVLPAAAGVLFGAIVTSVAMSLRSTPGEVAKIAPPSSVVPALGRGVSTVMANPSPRTDLNLPSPSVAVQSPQEGPRASGVAAINRPGVTIATKPVVAPPSIPPAPSTVQPVQAQLSQAIAFRNVAQDASVFAPAAPAPLSPPEAAPSQMASRSAQFAGAMSAAPLIAAANPLPSLPPLLFVPSTGQSADAVLNPPNSVSPPPVISGDGLPGAGFGGAKPGTPAGGVDSVSPPELGASAGDEIAWRRPVNRDALGSVAGGKLSTSGGAADDSGLQLMRLDTGMYPTLEYLCTVLEHDPVAHEGAIVEHSAPAQKGAEKNPGGTRVEQFCFRDAPEVKVLVVLDNGGAALSDTPGDTPVLSISAPFVGAF